jgi:hypothetical protein
MPSHSFNKYGLEMEWEFDNVAGPGGESWEQQQQFSARCGTSRTGNVRRVVGYKGKFLFEELKLGPACTKTLSNPCTNIAIKSLHTLYTQPRCGRSVWERDGMLFGNCEHT